MTHESLEFLMLSFEYMGEEFAGEDGDRAAEAIKLLEVSIEPRHNER